MAGWPRLWDIRVATWRFPRAGGADGEHRVVLEHNYLTTRQVVTLDGIRKADRTPVSNLENRHAFRCGDRCACACEVIVGRRFLTFGVRYRLRVNGGEERAPTSRERRG